MNKKIIITGATGFIGSRLCRELHKKNYSLIVFSRNAASAKSELFLDAEFVNWDYHNPAEWEEYIEGTYAVIHLAGESLASKRWTEKQKRKIIESREISTRCIIEAIGKADKKPETFICASAIGFYGNAGDAILTENSPNGKDFLSDVCFRWEKEAEEAEKFGVRRVSIRTGLALSPEGGAFKKLLLPYKLFAGGPLGSGKQWLSWLHIKDLIQIYIFALENAAVKGAINATSPNPVTNKELANSLGKILHRPSFFRVPEFVLKMVLGEMSETVLSSQKVYPERLSLLGYKFLYPEITRALKDLLIE
jgi:uncharacterized protein (TIGR01777 family)